MKVTEIGATVRLSKEVKGAWKSVELSAKADVAEAEAERWREKLAELYAELGQELRRLWSEPTERLGRAADPPRAGPAGDVEPPDPAP